MATTYSHAIIWPALDAAAKSGLILPPQGRTELEWFARNPDQEFLLHYREAMTGLMASMSPAEFEAVAAKTAEEINQFLAQKGIDIRLNSWGNDPETIGVASVLKLLKRRWLCSVETGYEMPTNSNEAYVLRPNTNGAPSFTRLGDEMVVHIPVAGDLTLHLMTNRLGGYYLRELRVVPALAVCTQVG